MKLNIKDQIQNHYQRVWNSSGVPNYWYKGPIQTLPNDFCVLEFAPTNARDMWTYATCCFWSTLDEHPIELHVFSSKQDGSIVELLTLIAHFHRNESKLDLNHTVNFGRPWQNDSTCDHGLISLPFLDGPVLEDAHIDGHKGIIKCYWLIPVTKKEVEFKKLLGIEHLEEKFEETGLNYLNPHRESVV